MGIYKQDEQCDQLGLGRDFYLNQGEHLQSSDSRQHLLSVLSEQNHSLLTDHLEDIGG